MRERLGVQLVSRPSLGAIQELDWLAGDQRYRKLKQDALKTDFKNIRFFFLHIDPDGQLTWPVKQAGDLPEHLRPRQADRVMLAVPKGGDRAKLLVEVNQKLVEVSGLGDLGKVAHPKNKTFFISNSN